MSYSLTPPEGTRRLDFELKKSEHSLIRVRLICGFNNRIVQYN